MIQDRNQLSLEVTVDNSITTANTSVSLGLIMTELVINALKHAFPGNRRGRILVDYRSHGPNWTLSVNDDGVGMSNGPENARAGLGTTIVEALSKQLGAEIKVADAHTGTKVSIAHASGPVLVAQVAVQPFPNSPEDMRLRVGDESQEQKGRVSEPNASDPVGYSNNGQRQMNFAPLSETVGDRVLGPPTWQPADAVSSRHQPKGNCITLATSIYCRHMPAVALPLSPGGFDDL
jgi:anti-sigma regulatory factor (Ser/Thr protein kinase)